MQVCVTVTVYLGELGLYTAFWVPPISSAVGLTAARCGECMGSAPHAPPSLGILPPSLLPQQQQGVGGDVLPSIPPPSPGRYNPYVACKVFSQLSQDSQEPLRATILYPFLVGGRGTRCYLPTRVRTGLSLPPHQG